MGGKNIALITILLALNSCCEKPRAMIETVYVRAKCSEVADLNYTIDEYIPLYAYMLGEDNNESKKQRY